MKELEPRFPGITAECVRFEVASEGNGDPARVVGEVDEEAWRDVAEADLPEEPAERLRAVVTRVVQALGARATVDVEETEEEIRATVNGEDLGLLIGKHGATIDALQHLAMRAALRGERSASRSSSTPRATASAARRRSTARPTAPWPTRCASGARWSSSRCARWSARSSTMYLRDRTDVETHSEGDEPDRRLVVSPRARLDRES